MPRQRTNTPRRPDDARAHRSIEALRSALLDLLAHKPLDQILIREITEAAGVSNPTFFRRFASKEDLLETIAREEVRALLGLGNEAFENAREEEPSGRNLCTYVESRRQLWSALLTGGAEQAMRREFARVATEIANSRPSRNPWIPRDLATAFTTSAIFEILAWWMRQPEGYPTENVVKIFDALVIDTVFRPRNIPVLESKPPAKKSPRPPRRARSD